MAVVLIVDDDIQVRETLGSLARRMGHTCLYAATLAEGREALQGHPVDVVFLDVCLPDGNGLDMLAYVRAASQPPEVIILTGQGDPDGAELAIQSGVWDYLIKPSPLKQIRLSLNRALAYREEKLAKAAPELDLSGLVGESLLVRESCACVAQASRTDATVLITGETGTGKELLARIIHRNSLRASGQFVVVDCAALTETLLESILFGHAKGAFTGAERDRVGLVQLADKGTLFLDEIGELPLSAQKVFLRVLQERTFRPVGSTQEMRSDFRLICATNRNLETMVARGQFRQDLFYRINTVHVSLPPLRHRGEDVIILAQYHLERLCRQRNVPLKTMDASFVDMLLRYDWPGNVRELFNTVEQAFVMAGGESVVYARHLPAAVRIRVTRSRIQERAAVEEAPTSGWAEGLPSLKEWKRRAERDYLVRLLEAHGRDIGRLQAVSGLSRSHLYAVLKKHGLDLPPA